MDSKETLNYREDPSVHYWTRPELFREVSRFNGEISYVSSSGYRYLRHMDTLQSLGVEQIDQYRETKELEKHQIQNVLTAVKKSTPLFVRFLAAPPTFFPFHDIWAQLLYVSVDQQCGMQIEVVDLRKNENVVIDPLDLIYFIVDHIKYIIKDP
jgi:hypothetical protein